MASVNLKSLMNRLSDSCRQTLEGAAGLCLSRTNYNVEIEHWLSKLLEENDLDLHALLRYYGVDHSQLAHDLTRSIDRLKTGNSKSPVLSPDTVGLAREAWVLASVDYSSPKIRSGHLLLALIADDSFSRIAREMSPEFARLSADAMRKDLPQLIANSSEAVGTAPVGSAPASPAAGSGPNPNGPSQTPALDQFTIDLTARARAGEIDPVLGRDNEVRQIVDILTRRRQNNPILTGEAGVGKTAVVEGFALRIASGDVPEALANVALRTLDLGLLQAGAGVKGEFENRLRTVIDEVNQSVTPVILFIDEAHTLIGAGGQAGQGDAANLLKPALARGELRTIAATTWAEYKKYFERDAALARRFQVVKVEEPEEDKAIVMMRGLVETLQNHHGVEILDEAVQESVKLSHRYISGRQLPDKSVSLLDTACARVAMGHAAKPPSVEDCERTITQTQTAIEILEREMATGANHNEDIQSLREEKSEAEARFERLKTQWDAERRLVELIRSLRRRLSGNEVEEQVESGEEPTEQPVPVDATASDAAPEEDTGLTDEQRDRLRAELVMLETQLEQVQGEDPLIQPCVDAQAVAQVVSAWTGIPVGRMVSDEIRTVLNLRETMEEYVVGQSHALDAIAQRIQTSRAKLTDPSRPIGVFFMVGPSGVGKTETAITLAELLYGGEQNMTVINMSEFKEEHKVSMLMGSPPGYVGYGEGGVLTEAVRRKPYSVILLDEMEKAHPGVQDIFYQVFDKGTMTDGEGREINFKNTVIIMTSNAATETIMHHCRDMDNLPDSEELAAAMHPALLKTFKPAFLGRMKIVPYFPLSDSVMRNIAELKLGKIGRRVRANYDAEFSYTDNVLDHIVSRCTEVDSGARNIDRILTGTLLPQMSAEFLSRMADEQDIKAVQVDVDPNGEFVFEIEDASDAKQEEPQILIASNDNA